MTSFLDALFEPERHCSCGHHEGSHNHGFTNRACMWCECRSFTPADESEPTPAGGPPSRRAVSAYG